MFNIEHFLLFTILFALSFLLTLCPQKNYEKNFWGTVAFFIIAYTLIVGLRYGWGHDYERYEFVYSMLEYDYSKDYDIAYWGLYKFEKSLGIPFSGSVVISTLLIIISYFYIVKAMKGDRYMLMCFLPATIMFTTYAMRQFHAIVYINIAIALLLFSEQLPKRKTLTIIISVILLLLAFHTHVASVAYAIPFLLFIFYKSPNVLPYKITVIAYIACIIFSNIINAFFSEYIINLTQNLIVTDHLQGYVNKADVRVLGEDSVDESTFAYGGAFQFFHYASYTCLLYIMGRALAIKPNKNVIYIYNIVVVAILLQEIFFSQEIMRRLIDPFVILYFIPLGYAINIYRENSKTKFMGYQFYGFCLLLLLMRIYYPFISFLTSFNLAGFVWD